MAIGIFIGVEDWFPGEGGLRLWPGEGVLILGDTDLVLLGDFSCCGDIASDRCCGDTAFDGCRGDMDSLIGSRGEGDLERCLGETREGVAGDTGRGVRLPNSSNNV